jgi:hypothetical protein
LEGFVMEWQAAERVQKNDAGQFRALIGGEWVPAEKAQKNEAGEYRVILSATSANKPPRTGNKLIDQIPGSSVQAPAPTAAPERPESGFLGKLLSPLETAVTLSTGVITAPIVEGAKIYGALTSGKFGTQQGIKAGEETGRKVQQFFQSPVSPESEAQTQAIGNMLASTGLQGVPLNVLGDLQRGIAPATRAATDAARAPVAARAARIQEGRIAESYANAPMIDATQAARRIGGAVPPAISNPTKANVIKGKLVGPELEQQFAKNNEVAVTEKVRKDLGVKPNEKLIPEIDETGKLNMDSPITRALDEASKPYDVIRQMEALTTPKESIDALAALKRAAPIGGDTKTAAINGLIDDALTKLQQTTSGAFSGVGGGPVAVGRSGAAVLDDIRSLRRDAQATYRAQKINPDPLATAKADTQMAIANILEDVIDANAPTPQVLSNLRTARTRMAQIYEHERAINYGQQKIDPQVYAKLYEERKGGMTGLNADIAQAASMFPDYFTLTPAAVKGLPRITRGGVGGAIGGALGVPLGPAGVVAGTAAGIGIGSAAGALAARRMATPAYQATNAMPRDYRPVPSGLRPVEPNTPTNALAPYDYSQQAFTPPNFVMQGEQYGPRVVPGTPQAPLPNTLGYNPNVPSTAEVQMNRLRAEDVMDRNFVAQRVAAQEAQQAAAEAAARQPARGGAVLDIDPVTGKISVGAERTGGMTPDIQIIESTGRSLSGAADILASGKSPALMSAEQRIAWDKTKVDLADVAPGMKAMTDKAIAAKMQDRAWVQDTITKAQEKARAFQDIAAKADNERLRQDALMKREQMMDLLGTLEEQFRKARPVKTGGQGPKTRAFQRNMLRPDDGEIQNALVK